jgi:hypothetical protein
MNDGPTKGNIGDLNKRTSLIIELIKSKFLRSIAEVFGLAFVSEPLQSAVSY